MVTNSLFLIALLFALEGSILRVTSQKCNANGFYCPSPDKYQLCIDDGPPLDIVPCGFDRTCDMGCSVECTKTFCTSCNMNGYSCASDTEFIVCIDKNDLPKLADRERCPDNYFCSRNCNSPSMCTPSTCPVTCTVNSRLPVDGNTTAYYRCDVDPATQEVTVVTRSCPAGSEFSPLLEKCTASATPTTTPTTVTTTQTTITTTLSSSGSSPKPHVCTVAGRFVDPSNCSRFHLCIEEAAGFGKYDYDCPEGTYFNSGTKLYSEDASVCLLKKSAVTKSKKSSVCLSENVRYEDSSSCNHYFICSWSDDELVPYRHTCPEGSVFNPDTARCTSSNNYYCEK